MEGFPRRGLAGLTSGPHPQEFFSKLQERTVAYINVDISVFGTARGAAALTRGEGRRRGGGPNSLSLVLPQPMPL